MTVKVNAGARILDGLRDALSGNFAAVTIEGQRWVRAPEWQTMETAPNDGTWILIFENRAKPLDTVIWDDLYGVWRNGYNDHPSYPTHWQPLPAPPEQS